MLPRRSLLLLRRTHRCRYYSPDSSDSESALAGHGYPFYFTPDVALKAVYDRVTENLSRFGLDNDLPTVWSMGQMLQTGVTALPDHKDPFPMTFVNFKVTACQPTYVPVWAIDADIRGMVSVRGGSRDAQLTVKGCVVPGHDHADLAKLSFRAPSVELAIRPGKRPVGEPGPIFPWLDRLLSKWPFRARVTELALGIVPAKSLSRTLPPRTKILPWEISPFIVPPLLRRIPERFASLNRDVKFQPSSIRFHVFAATPILYPVYMIATESGPRPIKTAWAVPAYYSDAWRETVAFMKRRLEVLSPSSTSDIPNRGQFLLDFSTKDIPEKYIDKIKLGNTGLTLNKDLDHIVEQMAQDWFERKASWATVIDSDVPPLGPAVWKDPRIRTYSTWQDIVKASDQIGEMLDESRYARQIERGITTVEANKNMYLRLRYRLGMPAMPPLLALGARLRIPLPGSLFKRFLPSQTELISGFKQDLANVRENAARRKRSLGILGEDVVRPERAAPSNSAAKKSKDKR